MSRLAIRYQLRAHGSKLSTDEAKIIDNKRIRLEKLIEVFERQEDSFLLCQSHTDDCPIRSLGDYDEYDHADDPTSYSSKPTPHHTSKVPSDGSGMEILKPEDHPILLPSSLGWEWCVNHGAQPLAVKEAQLRHAQANDSIHRIRLALGFKSAYHCQ